jgi:hypothetical protein
MTKKLVVMGFALVMVLGLAGCDVLEGLFSGTTGVEGKLELAAGVEGDLDDTKVYLFDNSNFDGSSEESEEAVEDEDDETEATFEFEEIDADGYYLLAWKDVDDDDAISYGDLVGIYDGKYGDDEPEEIDVDEGEMTDVGTIKMYEYEGGGSGSGSIQVNSSPSGATIYLDGSSTGKTTDALISNVSAGSHTIKLAKSGYNDWQQTVTVSAGQTTTVNATLTTAGGDITSISVSGSLEDYIGYTEYYLNVVFSQDATWDDYDASDYASVGLTFSNVTFDVPSGYQGGCYVIFWADQCAYLEGIGDPYLAEWIYGFYGDQGGEQPTYDVLSLQESYSGIFIDVTWYMTDGCPYEYTDVGQYPDLTSTKRIPNAK